MCHLKISVFGSHLWTLNTGVMINFWHFGLNRVLFPVNASFFDTSWSFDNSAGELSLRQPGRQALSCFWSMQGRVGFWCCFCSEIIRFRSNTGLTSIKIWKSWGNMIHHMCWDRIIMHSLSRVTLKSYKIWKNEINDTSPLSNMIFMCHMWISDNLTQYSDVDSHKNTFEVPKYNIAIVSAGTSFDLGKDNRGHFLYSPRILYFFCFLFLT